MIIKGTNGEHYNVTGQGQGNYNTVAGSLGIASFLGLNANNVLPGLGNNNRCCGSDDMPVSRYEARMQQELAAKDGKIALLESNIYTDSKITDAYKELRGMISNLQDFAARQAVQNQAFNDSFRDVQKDIDYKVQLEAERRACADCKIVNYMNSTFAPKLITDYGAGTTTAAATTYNPLACGRGCN